MNSGKEIALWIAALGLLIGLSASIAIERTKGEEKMDDTMAIEIERAVDGIGVDIAKQTMLIDRACFALERIAKVQEEQWQENKSIIEELRGENQK